MEAESVTYDGVSLFAVENPKLKGPCIIPAVGSTVLVGRIGGSNELYIAMFSQIDKVLLTIGDDFVLEIGSQGIGIKADTTTIQASTGGLTFSRGSSSLKKTLTDLCDALGALTVPTGTGPSGVPINKAQFDLIKQGLNDYLEA